MEKKLVTQISAILIICFIILLLVLYLPRNVKRDFLGVQINVGDENVEMLEQASLHFNGKFKKGLFSQPSFKGYAVIEINGDSVEGDISISFHKQLGGELIFTNSTESLFNTFGYIYIDNNFKQVAIVVSEPIDESNAENLNFKDSIIICAPALTRDEAIIISNKLMKSFLEKEFK